MAEGACRRRLLLGGAGVLELRGKMTPGRERGKMTPRRERGNFVPRAGHDKNSSRQQQLATTTDRAHLLARLFQLGGQVVALLLQLLKK